MAASQFKIFTSSDSGAPKLQGISGSLVALLDAVLVNGYGSKSALGWSKPLANDSLTSSLGCWKPASGSRMILYINDAAPSGSTTSGGREAWACGYETIVGLTGSTYPTTGTGYGVFPHYTQVYVSIASGTTPSSSLWWKKSSTADSASRNWILFGDAYTFYLFVQPSETANTYISFWFGDFYSFRQSDNYRGMIRGKMASRTDLTSYQFDGGDLLVRPNSTVYPHFFAARSDGGGAFSTALNIVGDAAKNLPRSLTTPNGSSETNSEMAGVIPFPNPVDGGIYISPLFVSEQQSGKLRGKIRGMYHVCHPTNYFVDGQEFVGSNEFAGRTFRCVKTGAAQFLGATFGTVWVMETSNTVETND